MSLDLALVVVSDVDACLLDDRTYVPEGSAPALEALRQYDVPLILCSSKTRAELVDLRAELGIVAPFISENGGALHLPAGYFPFEIPGVTRRNGHEVAVFGASGQRILSQLRDAAAETGVEILAFGDMSAAEVAVDCGLPLRQARLAKLREFDEPFRVIDPSPDARVRLHTALKARGLSVSTGGRYDHATGPTDKGVATAYLRSLYTAAYGLTLFVGLGDALNDVPLLRAVDVPVIVRSASGARTTEVHRQVPGARVTQGVGPIGWQEAVLDALAARARALCTRELIDSSEDLHAHEGRETAEPQAPR